MVERPPRARALREVAVLFLRLGATAFGGPAAYIAMMEDEVVRRRRWLTRERFLDLLGATNLIPGPNATEMAIHIGNQRAGWAGLIVSGTCFILPAAILTLIIAWAYVRFGSLPEAGGFFYGVKATILAVILQALWRLGKAAVKTKRLAVVCLLSIAANALGMHELIVLLGGGVLVALGHVVARRVKGARVHAAVLPILARTFAPAAIVGAAGAVAPFSLGLLFLFFMKTGAVLFGSGYVLLAFIRGDLVERWHWLTQQQLLDAIAVGQMTPGPVFSTATFIGYILGDVPGAALATVGIFLPAFFFVAVSGPLVPRLRRSPTAGAFLDGVVVSSLALMAVVTWQLGRAAIVDVPSAALALVSGVLLMRLKLNSAWIVVAGGLLGLVITWIR